MVTISFLLLDGPLPLADAQVRLWSEDGTTFVTQGVTDANGEVTFDVPEERYSIRCFKTGYAFPSRLQALAEDGALFQVDAENLNTHPPSTVTHACRVTGFVMDAAGGPLEGATFEFKLTDYGQIAAQRFSAAAKVIVRSDTAAKIDVHLIRNAVYDVVVESMEDRVFRVRVPDASAADITELIWPKLTTYDWSETDITIEPEEVAVLYAEPILSSGNSLPYDLDGGDSVALHDLVEPVSSDLDVVAVSLSGNELHITGIAVGTAEITFVAKDGAFLHRLDEEVLPTTSISVEVA